MPAGHGGRGVWRRTRRPRRGPASSTSRTCCWSPRLAIEEHRDVAEELRARYRHFVVDEYQDVNPLQQRLLDAWLGGRDDLCVVGDPNQTIYSFTGADPGYLLGFPRRFPGATVVKLVRDYRSTPQVVELANRLIGQARRTAAAGSGSGRRDRSRPSPSTTTSRPRRRRWPACAGPLIDGGTPASEIAVLFRINAQSEAYEPALADAGVPYVLRAGSASSSGPRSGRRCCCCAGRPGPPSPGTSWSTWSGTCCPGPAGSPARRPAAAPPGSAGSRSPRWSASPRSSPRCSPRPGWATSSPSWSSGPPHSTRRPCRASRSRRCTRPRGWSGTRSSWSGWSRARCRSSTRSPTSRSRRSGGCSTSG